MRIARYCLMLAGLSLAGCALPRPNKAAAYTGLCSEEQALRFSGLLFYTTRRADCRKNSTIQMSWYRSEKEQFRQGLWAPRQVQLLMPDAWTVELERQISEAKGATTILYIHGFNNNHNEALARANAILIAAGKNSPVVAFTWPSYASRRKYFWDEVNAEWTGPKAMELLDRLTSKGRKVIIVAHSMGNRIALDLIRTWPKHHPGRPLPVERLIMASPDVDRDWFAQQAAELPVPITLYGSTHDQPLSASWRSHGYARAGDFSKWVTGNDIDPIYPYDKVKTMDVVDTSPVRSGRLKHSDFIESAKGAADLCRVVNDSKPRLGRNIVLQPNFYQINDDYEPVDDKCVSNGQAAARSLTGKSTN